MKKYIVSVILLIGSFNLYGENDEIFDVIAGGAEEYEFVRYSPEEIQLKIKEDMMVACKDGLCTIFAITEKGDEFQVAFNVGYGEVIDGDASTSSDAPGGPFVGLTVSYTYSKCVQEIQVPRSVYISINTYMYGLLTENGEPQRTMLPATEAMIVFYSTIMKQAGGCN